MDLRGRHALITGASRGIGAAMATGFADAGARVSLVARDQQQLEALAAELDGTAFPADLLDQAAVDGLIDRVEGSAGPIDVLVNNAGVVHTTFFTNQTPEQIRSVIRLNLEAPMLLTGQLLPRMMDRDRGHLVFTSSLAGTAGFPGLSVYGGTKAGINNFVNALRLELKGTSIGTTVVAPGPVDTDMGAQLESPDLVPTMKRLRLLQLVPARSPEWVAAETVAAVQANKANVRSPRRLSSNFWFTSTPSRLTELVLKGVATGPRA
jgi:short-subunit dehydrogenase